MRQMLNLRVVLIGAVMLTISAAAWVDASGRFCRQQPVTYGCAPVNCCPQIIYVEKIVNGGGGGGGGGGNSELVDPNSHKVRAIIVLDNNDADPAFNKEIDADGNKLRDLLAGFSYTDLADTSFLSKKQVTRENILHRINTIPVGPKDVLFVYYNGHGKDDGTPDKGHYFDLSNKAADGGPGRLYRKEVLDAMKSRKCLLTVLISDTCYKADIRQEEEPELRSTRKSRFSGEQAETITINAEMLSELFLKHEGLVNINSCSPSEVAFGGFFTPTLVETCQKWSSDTYSDTLWNAFFEKVKKQTSDKAKEDATKVDESHDLAKQGTQTPIAFDDLKTSVKRWEYQAPRDPADQVDTNPPESPTTRAPEPKKDVVVGSAPAIVRVEVPAAAKIYVDDMLTQPTTAAIRIFNTPDLAVGTIYHYTLRAELQVDGLQASVTQKVQVEAGKTSSVDLANIEIFRRAVASSPVSPALADFTDR